MLLLLSILTGQFAFAQNLVPNPSFENYSACPENISEIDFALPWTSTTGATPDYYNSCSTTLWSTKIQM